MNSSDLVLNEWLKQISQYDKLKLGKAQDLCIKAFNTSDEKMKKLYMDKVILGTLYVVYNYITRNDLSILSSKSYDLNDIISSFIEVWIQKIYNGELLNIDKYSSIFTKTYFNEVYNKLVGKDIIVHETFGMPTDLFVDLFYVFIQFKNKGSNFNYSDLIKVISKDEDHYLYLIEKYDSSIMLIFESIYNNLNFNKDENLEIGITKINDFFKVFVDIGITESISNKLLDTTEIECYVINKVLFKPFINDIDKALANDMQRQVIHERYGLDDGTLKSLEEVAKIHNITRERVRQIERKSLRILQHPTRNINTYI